MLQSRKPLQRAARRALTWALSLQLFVASALPSVAFGAGKEFIPPKPTQKSQTQKTSEERGVNPCNTKDPGPGIYDPWNRNPSIGQMLVPGRGGMTKDGKFDVMIHFHGHDPVRKEWTQAADGAVLVGITLGIGSGVYQQTFANPHAFENLIKSVEEEMSRLRGVPNAKARKIGISAWSAGYGAVEQILRQDYGKKVVDSVILLDGLHTGYDADGSLNESQLEPFIDFAKRAKAGKRFMFVSHSSIIPPGYASTTESVKFLIHAIGGKPNTAKPRRSDPMGLDLNSKYDAGNFHARGFDGNDKMDHCAHIGLMRDVLRSYVKKRWNTPKGHAKKVGEKSKPKTDKPKTAGPVDGTKSKKDGRKARPKVALSDQ